jgi:hypothetical protein
MSETDADRRLSTEHPMLSSANAALTPMAMQMMRAGIARYPQATFDNEMIEHFVRVDDETPPAETAVNYMDVDEQPPTQRAVELSSPATSGADEFHDAVDDDDSISAAGISGASNEDWRRGLPAEWLPFIDADVQTLKRAASTEQRPFSDAYLAGMSSKRRRVS